MLFLVLGERAPQSPHVPLRLGRYPLHLRFARRCTLRAEGVGGPFRPHTRSRLKQLILLGIKDVENHTWAPRDLCWVVVHAGVGDHDEVLEMLDTTAPDGLDRSSTAGGYLGLSMSPGSAVPRVRRGRVAAVGRRWMASCVAS
jgi:hypothetical protein